MRDFNDFFTPEDFNGELARPGKYYAESANKILRAELKRASVVYGEFTEKLKKAGFSSPLDWTERYHPQPTHTARLIQIEEIKRG